MPVLNSEDEEWGLDELVAIHGLHTVKDKQFAIEGIALDLGITPEEAVIHTPSPHNCIFMEKNFTEKLQTAIGRKVTFITGRYS